MGPARKERCICVFARAGGKSGTWQDPIKSALDAEARGQYEILAKKGEGLQRIVEACGGSHQAFQLLMLEHLDHLAEASSRAISNIKFDKVVVWDSGHQNGRNATADFLSGLAKTGSRHCPSNKPGDLIRFCPSFPASFRVPWQRGRAEGPIVLPSPAHGAG